MAEEYEPTDTEKLLAIRRFVAEGLHRGALYGGPEEYLLGLMAYVGMEYVNGGAGGAGVALKRLLAAYDLTHKDWTPADYAPEKTNG